MKAKTFPVIILLAVLTLLLSTAATAQGPQPPAPPYPTRQPGLPPGAAPREPEFGKPFGPYRMPDGYWVVPEGARPPLEAAGISPQATGGPDDFGYTWNDEVTFNWIDATGGTDTGLSGNSYGQKVGPVSLPFSFKYYENTYTSLYIAASGYLAFTDEGTWPSQPHIPSLEKPNNIIAPYVTFLNLATSGPTNRVYYASGGTAPNRYFVVEWYQVVEEDETYTYEVILHENGDIVFQYQAMIYNDGVTCGSAGIEDSTGLDGLSYLDFCELAPPYKAVRFYRPAPSARVSIRPAFQSRFTRAGATESFQVPIRNTGELGADTYDLSVSSPWTVGLYRADGTTPLTDTDGDGTVDTGSVDQGSTVTITVKVQTPAGTNVGDNNSASITARSSLDTGKSKTVTLQTAVPAPFVQVYRDKADNAMSLYLVQPAAQTVKKATSNGYYGYGMAVAEAPNGNFIYAWYKGRCLDSNCNIYGYEIEYALLDRYGNIVRPVGKLTDHTNAAIETDDYSHAVAVAPNGRIGVLWYRHLWDQNTSQFNQNIYFAILDASGNRLYGPVNLTNNTAWGTWSDLNAPQFYSPHIAATGDNRFVLAWELWDQESDGWVYYDIYYTVRDTNGGAVKGITRFTNSIPIIGQGYHDPALVALNDNRVLLAYSRSGTICYAVLDSGGNTVKPQTSIESSGWSPDARQLSDGRIVIAWQHTGNIYFTVLDANYNLIAGPTTLSNPASLTGDAYVSVAADAAGHAILTWMDSDWDYRRNLYYALVDGNGNVLTPPMIFRTSQAANPRIESSYEGYGNTSYSWTPPLDADGVVAFSASLFGGPPGGNAVVGVHYANHSATSATGVVLTATLDSNLTYVNDTSGVMPTISGSDVVWNLSDLGFLESHDFTLYVQVPSDADYGIRYPITLTLTSSSAEANTSDNTANAEVMAARQVFLPLVARNR